MKFSKLTPKLQTEDMDATVAWYESILGFRCVSREGDGWCHLKRDEVSLMFSHNAHLGAPQAAATQYIYVDDVAGLWESIREHCTAEWGPEKYAYGMFEFAIKDPNGYLLSFGQPVETLKS